MKKQLTVHSKYKIKQDPVFYVQIDTTLPRIQDIIKQGSLPNPLTFNFTPGMTLAQFVATEENNKYFVTGGAVNGFKLQADGTVLGKNKAYPALKFLLDLDGLSANTVIEAGKTYNTKNGREINTGP